MKSRWSDEEASRCAGDLALRVYSSRLLGAESSLVLHGGGNTSVKSSITDLFGAEESVLYVKGSGWDLETIAAAGFSPCRMQPLLALSRLEALSDPQMAAELRKSLTDVGAPSPSVEAILHAILPARFVDHTHADSILTMTNSPHGEQRVRELFGDRLVYIPYVMPGFKLARLCAEVFPAQARRDTVGMLLLKHGLFTFGETAKDSYERMIELVSLAEGYLAKRGACTPTAAEPREGPPPGLAAKTLRTDIAALRKAVSDTAGSPMILSIHTDAEALGFAGRADVGEITQRGPATPDHVLRTKRVPLVGRDVAAYASAYREYFRELGNSALTMLDPAPRVILDPQLGLGTIGRTAKDAAIVDDIYRHTMHIISGATVLGGWEALPARDIFDVEYWDLEQAKLRKGGSPPVLTGEVAVVTGAASGIGKACVASLLSRGAAVVALDRSPEVGSLHRRKDYLGLTCDVTSESEVDRALEGGMRTFGGLDMLILNAGIFPPSAPVSALASDVWRNTMSINLDANFVLLRESHPLLKLAPRGGRVVIIGSKNVPAPGPGAAAYSASKAALQQLARVVALEWGGDRIRVNTIHPNAVFDTGIWTPEVISARAASHGMSSEEYKTNNVLKVEVTSRDVAELAAELCGPVFAKTTGAQIPVDGGTVRVI
ncbi:MAG TPA: bifunctional aldolase/short-chain dehydrogenase [Steroidobacteraceae bacterium]|jgi:rhamnose utilization protein RhaD (predicted bifunctional aldolase and dehydrogenase)/NAD(P)-dependent dehydrogenase (short-subunit alcohol dehydrogenase family)|nr:bifunctional aldolase/short-chain dehydrogenase [Steroidobacteraceae bacterium]